MRKPRICGVIADNNPEAVAEIAPLVDLFEVRIDLIGDDWPEVVRRLNRPWIACNRMADEGGHWQGNEAGRIERLLQAVELGADIVDIEFSTKNLGKIVPLVKRRARCLLSFHDLEKTPPLNEMKGIVKEQLKCGADIAKVVTTARQFADNLMVLRLIAEFPEARLVSFAMGAAGSASRILGPLVGGDFTYAALAPDRASAPGQLTVSELAQIYDMVKE